VSTKEERDQYPGICDQPLCAEDAKREVSNLGGYKIGNFCKTHAFEIEQERDRLKQRAEVQARVKHTGQ
jgi:hypothetical protein